MPKFETIRIVKHSPEVMFDLVADGERYPEFVPMCTALHIRRRSEATRSEGDGGKISEGDGGSIPIVVLIADMSIGYKMIRETFTSRVELDRENLTIRVTYVDGPFRHLENRWTFVPRENGGCEVKFFIDYEFKSRTFQMLAGAVFETVFRKMAEAFETRADALARKIASP